MPSDDNIDETPTPPPDGETNFSKNNSGPWFSLDDVSPLQWNDKFKEFAAWLDNQIFHLNANPCLIMIDFMSRTTNFLRDCWQSLGEYRQFQFLNFSLTQAISELCLQFMGKELPSNNRTGKTISP